MEGAPSPRKLEKGYNAFEHEIADFLPPPAAEIVQNPIPGTRLAVLQTIRELPKAERERAIAEYREYIAQQKTHVAFLYSDLTRLLEENPSVPDEELQKKLSEVLDRIQAGGKTRKEARDVFMEFSRRRKAIESYRAKHPDDKELYEAIFGRKPSGEVAVITTPFMLYFQCANLEDYADGYFYGFTMDTEDKVRLSRRSGGANLHHAPERSLQGALALENIPRDRLLRWSQDRKMFNRDKTSGAPPSITDLSRGSQKVAKHEQEHAVHRLFTTHIEPVRRFTQESSLEVEMLRKARRWRESGADRQVRTELLAYYSEGRSREAIEETLLSKGGLYNYFQPEQLMYLESILSGFIIDPFSDEPRELTQEEKTLIHGIVTQILTEYERDLHSSMDALFMLGNFESPQVITSYLVAEPITKWPRVVHDMLRSRLGASKGE